MPALKETKKLYNGEVSIDFYPDSHRYKMSDQKSYLISVTAVTGIIDKSRVLIGWAINLMAAHLKKYLEISTGTQFTAEELLPVIEEASKQHTIKKEEAGSIGGKVHEWAESFANAQINGSDAPEIKDDEEQGVLSGINAFLDWYNAHEIKFLESERLIYSRKYNFVGTLDGIAMINGKRMLIDYKTSKGIYSEMHYQISAYRLAWEEETGEKLDGMVILHFDKESGAFTAKEFSDEDYAKNWPTFLACLEVKKREKELAAY